MGEAKRRKKSGNYPDTGSVYEFRVPGGKLGITIDVQGEPPSTVLYDADKIADLLNDVERAYGEVDSATYHETVNSLAHEFVARKRQGGDLVPIGHGILWSVFYHPKKGANLRFAISRRIHEKGQPHVTWQVTKLGSLAIAIGDQFLDLEKLADVMPKDRVTTFDFSKDDKTKPN